MLEEHLGTAWGFTTRIVFDAPSDEVAPFLHGPMGHLEPLDDGRWVLTGSTRNPQMYAGEWLAGMPFDFRVEDGPELREAMTELSARLVRSVAAYPP